MATELSSPVLRDLQAIFNLLRSRRGMYIGDGFDALVAFLVGYSEATKQSAGVDLMASLQDFVKTTLDAEFALSWPHYLLKEVAKGDEIQATQLVFSILDKFISEEGVLKRTPW